MTSAPLPSRAPPRPSRWLQTAAQLIAFLALYLGMRAFLQRGIASGSAPALAGPDLAGRAFSLDAERGHPVAVHFWATWCPVCMAEIGSVDALAHGHPVVTVATSSGEAAAIRAVLGQRGLSFPVVVDRDGELAHAWGVSAFPTTFFVGADQRIRFAERGFTTGWGMRARLWMAGL